MFKENILGLDIDGLEMGKELLRMFRVLGINGKYRLSSSKQGYHFKLDTLKHTKEESLKIRYIFNDDYGRFIGDVRRLKAGIRHFDILFDKKKGKRCGVWRDIQTKKKIIYLTKKETATTNNIFLDVLIGITGFTAVYKIHNYYSKGRKAKK